MQEKQINRDWTLKEWRNPRKNDVVQDSEGQLGIVVRTKGDPHTIYRNIWVESIDGELIWEDANPKDFELCSHRQTRDFYLLYKERKGWKVGTVFTITGKDHPLLLVDMEYDLVNQEMVYVFKDLCSPTEKFFKTLKEHLISPIEGEFQDIASSAFIEDETSSLRYKLEVQLVDRGEKFHEGWSVSGSSIFFGEEELAREEIERWVAKMKVRRIASVLSKITPASASHVVISDDGELYIREVEESCGQPAIFKSKVAAGIAIAVLSKETWLLALENNIDGYMF